jgi:hypothetical protein
MSQHLQYEHISEEMHECIERCSDCHDVCLATVIYCLNQGGEHAAPEHIRTLLDCAQACDTSRDFLLRGSALHRETCRVCAEACDRCTDSCEHLDDDVTRRCAEECRRCAASCRAMAK